MDQGDYLKVWNIVSENNNPTDLVKFYIKTKQYRKAQNVLKAGVFKSDDGMMLQSKLNLSTAEYQSNLIFLNNLNGSDTSSTFEAKRLYCIAQSLLGIDSISAAQNHIISSIEIGKTNLDDQFKLEQLLLLGKVLHAAEKKNESLQILASAEVLANSEDTNIPYYFKQKYLIQLQIEKAVAYRKMGRIKESLELLTGAELSIYSIDKIWALELKSKIYQAFQVALFIEGNKDKMFAYQIKSTLNEKILNEKLYDFFDEQTGVSTIADISQRESEQDTLSIEENTEKKVPHSSLWQQEWIIYFGGAALIILVAALWIQRIISKKNLQIEKTATEKEEIQEAFALYQKEILRKSTSDHKKIIQEVGMLTKRQSKWSKQLDQLYKSSKKLKKQDIIDAIEQLSQTIDDDISLDKKQSQLNKSVHQVSEDFKERLKLRYPDLIRSEIELCALIRLRMSNREIAEVRNISISSARTARYRLKKKLNIPENLDIEKVLTAI